jgi:hypothetical protein
MMTPIEQAGLATGKAVVSNPAVQAAFLKSWTKIWENIRVSFLTENRLRELVGDHLEIANTKCKFIRTFLNEDENTLLSDIYVAPFFAINHDQITEDQVFKLLTTHKRLLIEGIGGMGKTIFMKRFWSRLYDEGDVTIPVFLELRRYNNQIGVDFENFVRMSISNAKMTVTEFEKLAGDGRFTFFFDGFDEVNSEARPAVELGVRKFNDAYKNSRIIVSTRPDLYLRGWEAFKVVRPIPFNMDQSIEVVERATFDSTIKKNFIAQVKSELYQTHSAFLSNPLLINIMLLTFREYAEIPRKVTVFYDRAFDALYSKHDAKKDGWQREKRSNISFDDFKLLFGHFCFVSYSQGAVDFRWEGFKRYTETAVRLAGISVKAEDFLADLKDAVCLLREEGDQYHFNHRSFQEFFSAYALNKLTNDQIYRACLNFIARGAGSVVKMFSSYDRTVFERDFAIRYIEEVLEKTTEIVDIESAQTLFNNINGGVFIEDSKFFHEQDVNEHGVYFVGLLNGRVNDHFFRDCFDILMAIVDKQISKSSKSPTRYTLFQKGSPHLLLTVGVRKTNEFESMAGFPIKRLTSRARFSEEYVAIASAICDGLKQELKSMKLKAKDRDGSADEVLASLFS